MYVPQYREFNFSNVECEMVELTNKMTWAESVIELYKMLEKCIASIETIERTLNHE